MVRKLRGATPKASAEPGGDDDYRAIVDGLHHGVLILQDARIAFVNRALSEATGFSREELLGLGIPDLLERTYPADRDVAAARIAARQGEAAEPTDRTEVRLRCKDGSWRWFETHGRSITFRGAPAIAVSLVDATERKRTEQELSASDARLRLLVEGRNEWTMEADAAGIIVHVSPGMAEGLGLPIRRLLGRPLKELVAEIVHPDDVPDGTQNLLLLAAGGVLDDAIHRVRRSDGEFRWWETSGRPLETEGGTHIVLLSRDVTDRLAAEEERAALADRLHQTQKLEGLGLLAGGIAHDFNNLMVAVRTNAELASHTLDAGSPAREYVGDIGLAAEHARELTRKLLAYAGRRPTALEVVDVTELATSIAQLYRGTLSEPTELSVDDDGEPAPVIGDEAQLGQLVLNLLLNAGESLEDGRGAVALRTGVRSLRARDLARCVYAEGGRPGWYAYVSVADSGSGISPEHVGRVFDPFFTTKAGGGGLGLASVLGTVRAHQGALRLVTRVGVGTRFEVYLPIAEGAAAVARARTDAVTPAEAAVRGAILVVDDRAPVRRAAARLLQLYGFETIEAAGGREALEIARRAPDALGAALLDVTMSDFGGNRVFAELRRMRSELPIVFMSGHSEEDVEALTKDRTRVATIAKPFSGAELIAALHRATSEGDAQERG